LTPLAKASIIEDESVVRHPVTGCAKDVPRRKTVWFLRALIVLVGVIVVLWLGMQNAGERVDFYFFHKAYLGMNLNLLLLLVFIAGMVLSFLIAAVSELNLRRQLSRYRRELGRAEREMSALRSLPLDDAGAAQSDADIR
jgi:uncharacterized integral membrane protein